MEANQAAEHLQTIRTLMERSAVYRRALAPVMTYNGIVGTIAAGLGLALKIGSARPYIMFWAGVAGVAVIGSFVLVRRQALKDSEPFWSPPTRRVTEAFLPPLFAGSGISAVIWLRAGPAASEIMNAVAMVWLPLGWLVLYGCAMNAAGFFMTRGVKLFGWAFILAGCGLFAVDLPAEELYIAHGIMGVFFGLLHLAYGIYLYFTERKNAA